MGIFDEMKRNNVWPDVISYSAAISACEKGGETAKALEIFDEMKQNNVWPDVISYSAAISACEKGGERAKGECIYREAVAHNVFQMWCEDFLELHGWNVAVARVAVSLALE